MESYSFHLMPYPAIETDEAWPFAGDTYDPDVGAACYETYYDQLVYCEELGFDGVGVNEHHYSPYGMQVAPNISAAHVAARTETIDVALMGNVVPVRENPIRLAEEIAMLDNVTGGRITSGFVRGIPTEYFAYDVEFSESRSRWAEAWDLIEKAWTADEPFDFEGEHFHYENVYIWPRPVQDPYPPRWMPAESEESLRFAAEREVPIGQVFYSTDEIREIFEKYRSIAESEFDRTPGDGQFTINRTIYVADSMEQARADADEHLRYYYETLLAGIHKGGTALMAGDDRYHPEKLDEYAARMHPAGELAMNYDFDEFQEMGEIIVGTPEYVAAEIERQYEDVGGFGRLGGLFQFGTLPDEEVRRSLELYADEVMPAVRRIGDGM